MHRIAPAFVPAVETEAAPVDTAPVEPDDVPAEEAASTETFRRTALAEFTALATSSGDDFTFRRH
jgi:hypothetical protein